MDSIDPHSPAVVVSQTVHDAVCKEMNELKEKNAELIKEMDSLREKLEMYQKETIIIMGKYLLFLYNCENCSH